MVGLGFLPGGGSSSARGVNADGAVVVGQGDSSSGGQAFRWTAGGGMVGLGDLPGGTFSSLAHAVNADGSVVVGESQSSKGQEAFYWTTAKGMRSHRDILASAEVSVAGISLRIARDVSDNGLVVVGEGNFGNGTEGFVARLGDAAGLITLAELSRSITQTSVVIEGVNTARLFDLRSLAMAGTKVDLDCEFEPVDPKSSQTYRPCHRFSGFVVGSIFRQSDDEFDSLGGSGIVGLAMPLLPSIVMGLGAVVSSNNGGLPSLGDFNQRSLGGGFFVSYRPEERGLQIVASGLVRDLETEVDRGYLNGSGQSFSHGKTDGVAWAGLVRAGYQSPFFGLSVVTPFLEFAAARTELDSYAEAGGAFPITFDETIGTTQRLRVGTEVRAPLTPAANWWAWLAWNHRLGEEQTNISGQVQGLFAFDLPGISLSEDGADAGVGLTWHATSRMQFLGSIGTAFDLNFEPEVVGRIGAKVQLGSLD